MDNTDKEFRAKLFYALKRMNDDISRLNKNREKRLWTQVDLPCGLFDALSRLTKPDLDIIRQKHDFKNISSLNKTELAAELTRLLPQYVKKVVCKLDKDGYSLIEAIIKNSGFLPDKNISASRLKLYMGYGMVFPGLLDDRRVLFIPRELTDALTVPDDGVLKRVIDRNSEWVRLAHGMLFYYGYMDAVMLHKKIEELTGREADISELMDVMSIACDLHGQAQIELNGYKDARVSDAEKLKSEQKKKTELDYYRFTKDQLMEAGAPGYMDNSVYMRSFTEFFGRYYKMSKKKISSIAARVIQLINYDDASQVTDYLFDIIELPPLEILNELNAILNDLHNNTRQWVLKGYTPIEAGARIKNTGRLSVSITSLESTATPKNRTVTKVGRNEPCPCGSGKKYKKCCGR